MKICCKCKESKEKIYFYKDKNSKDGFDYSCKLCRNNSFQEFKKTDRYKIKVRKQKWKEQNIDINYEKYQEMFKNQGGKCAICDVDGNQFGKGMCVDHDHKTGKIRGLLCTDCNMGIGSLKDSIQILKKAVKYLKLKE